MMRGGYQEAIAHDEPLVVADGTTPSRGDGRTSFAFGLFLFFTFVVFVAPQNVYAFLQPLRLARTSALLAIVGYLARRLTQGGDLLPRTPEFRLLLGFTALMFASIPLSIWPGGAFNTIFNLYLKSFCAALLCCQLLDTVDRWKRMMWTLIVCGLAAASIGVLGDRSQLVEGYRIGGAWAGIASNPNDFALTLNLVMPFAVVSYLVGRRWQKVLCAAFVLVAIWGILLTFSRGGMITLVAVAIFLVVRLGRGVNVRSIIGALAVLMALAVFAPSEWSERLQSVTDFSKDRTGSADERWLTTVLTLEVIAESPLVGVGAGMNVLALNDKGRFWSQVHNVLLQIASELGIPAAILFAFLFFKLLRSARDAEHAVAARADGRELTLHAIACQASLVAFGVAAMFHPVAYHFYFYYVAGMTMAFTALVRGADAARSAESGATDWWRADPR